MKRFGFALVIAIVLGIVLLCLSQTAPGVAQGGQATLDHARVVATLHSAPVMSIENTSHQSPGVTFLQGCELPEDVNNDGVVNLVDVQLVASRWRARQGEANYIPAYDLDSDGDIDIVDIMRVSGHWGQTCVDDVAGLIAAINTANANGPGLDTINLAPKTYTLTAADNGNNGLPVVTSNITINGDGATITRDSAAPPFRIFEITTTGSLTLNSLTLSGGRTAENGGAIYNNGGILNIISSTLSGNTATYHGGWVGYYDAVGGAIYNNGGTVNITSSTLSGNTGERWGGGIWNDGGKVTVVSSTISNNNAGGVGGGIDNNSGTVTVTNSTLSGNTANFGGGIGNYDTLNVMSSTISSNTANIFGGGIDNLGAMTLTNSILYANVGGGIENRGVTMTANYNCILGNVPQSGSSVVQNGTTVPVDATNNWWGANDGPSGAGPGSGDSVSANVTFIPFLTAPIPGCPTDLIITAVTATADAPHYQYQKDQYYIGLGVATTLTATVYGANGFNPQVAWSIVSGGGILSASSGASITFTGPITTGTTIVRAAAVGDPSKYADLSIRIANVSVGARCTKATVLTNGSVPLSAGVVVDGDYDYYEPKNLTWSIVSGGGSLADTPGGWGVTFTAPNSTGTTIVRVRPVGDPSKYLDFTITIVASGPHTCSNPPVIPCGQLGFSSSGHGEDNWPTISRGVIGEYDPLIGETQTVTVTVGVRPPATYPIQTVTVVFVQDSGRSPAYPLTLISGTNLNGEWLGSWVVSDTHCYIYRMEITATNEIHSTVLTVTLR